MSDCYSTGTVSNSEQYTGGLVGANVGTVSNCHAAGKVTSTGSMTGGLAGRNSGTISNCYATGSVSGGSAVGCVGSNLNSVSNCLYDSETTGMSDTGKGTPKTIAEMQDIATFTETDTETDTEGLDNPWDFTGTQNDDGAEEDIWGISSSINNGYPFLNLLQASY